MTGGDWTQLTDEQLLELRISQLGLNLAGTPLEGRIKALYRELEAKGLTYRPPCFLADEWFCPVGVGAIGIPFYLVHPRLQRLEQKIMLEVEGGTVDWFMQLLRHEAGHAYSYAYRLYRKKRWQKLFGLASSDYKDTYRPRPYSRAYVIHLDHWYAQAHPDEDFAETFAVWLTPDSDWARRFRGWKAIAKLEYVDELMRSLAGQPAVNPPTGFRPNEHAGLRIKLGTHYRRKRKLYEGDYPDVHDRDLRQLFTSEGNGEFAARYLRRYRKQIQATVAQWTKEKRYTIDRLLSDLIERCEELELRIRSSDQALDYEVIAYVTTMVMNYLFTGKFKRSK